MLRLNEDQARKFILNLLVFTTPALAVFFGQLAAGVDWKVASGVALLALWGILADYFKKLEKTNG